MSLVLNEQYLLEDESFLGLSSRCANTLNVGIFDYDNYPHNSQSVPFCEGIRIPRIWIQTSKGHFQLIMPQPMSIQQIDQIFWKLRPHPCVLNYANGKRKGEWVSRLSMKKEKPDSKIKVLYIDTEGFFKLSKPHISFYECLKEGKIRKRMKGLELIRYRRFKTREFDIPIEL